eukprot:15481569-Alexandrium_andersonii.AAC.1
MEKTGARAAPPSALSVAMSMWGPSGGPPVRKGGAPAHGRGKPCLHTHFRVASIWARLGGPWLRGIRC